jgi:deoxyguanosine kinase
MTKRGLIAIAGIVGVGKTTLAENLASELTAELILEEYDQNPFLADQVSGKPEAALPSELFFLFSRVRQLRRDRIEKIPVVVCDYVFHKNRIFAQMNLDRREYATYRRLEQAIESYITPPNVVLYLYDDIEMCLDRIARRGREFEKTFSADFLQRLHEGYELLFCDWQQCPVIRIDAGPYDFRRRPDVRQILSQLDRQG